MNKTTEEYVVETLRIVMELFKEFEDIVTTITKQKPFATIDYKSLDRRLEEVFKDARDIEQEWKSNRVVLEHFDSLLSDFRESISAFGEVFDGLKIKAEAIGKYSWFSYRKDLKKFNTSYEKYQNSRMIFGATIS